MRVGNGLLPVYCVDSTAGVQSFAASQIDGAHPPDRVRRRRSRGLRLQGARGRAIAAEPHVREGARPPDGRRLPRARCATTRRSRHATRSARRRARRRLDIIYAYYRAREQESAVDAADQFVRENPTHPRVDYAMYLRGLVYFERSPNFLERWFNTDLTRAPAAGRQARVRRLRAAHPATPRQRLRARRAPAHGLPAQPPRRLRGVRRATTTCGARPMSPRSTARATASRTTTARRRSGRPSRS